jgi:hypothetical protein
MTKARVAKVLGTRTHFRNHNNFALQHLPGDLVKQLKNVANKEYGTPTHCPAERTSCLCLMFTLLILPSTFLSPSIRPFSFYYETYFKTPLAMPSV